VNRPFLFEAYALFNNLISARYRAMTAADPCPNASLQSKKKKDKLEIDQCFPFA
jgi:hypothetical protein